MSAAEKPPSDGNEMMLSPFPPAAAGCVTTDKHIVAVGDMPSIQVRWVDGDTVQWCFPPSGDTMQVAFDYERGKILWRIETIGGGE